MRTESGRTSCFDRNGTPFQVKDKNGEIKTIVPKLPYTMDNELITPETRQMANARYKEIEKHVAESKDLKKQAYRKMAKKDRFFLLTKILNRPDADQDWCYCRCREVEKNPDDYLDLWAREHYKSTLITFAGAIQEIIKNPNITILIFSFKAPIAKHFLKQIKYELEQNELLKWLFPEIFWDDPIKDARRSGVAWSVDEGIFVKRPGRPKEPTIMASGLVDGQPTGMHFDLRIYNDIVTIDNCRSPEQIAKTTDSWGLSHSLGAIKGSGDSNRCWYEGTIYNYSDTYAHIMKEAKAYVTPRIYPCTQDGMEDYSKTIFMPEEVLKRKRTEQGKKNFAYQMLLNPNLAGKYGFKREWMRYYDNIDYDKLNTFIFLDPAKNKTAKHDFTSGWVIGYGHDHNYYVLDMLRDRLDLDERTKLLFKWHQQWRPIMTFYERYGKDSDTEHIMLEQDKYNYRFPIQEVGGTTDKITRIERLIPGFKQSKFWFPHSLEYYPIGEDDSIDLVDVFIEEEFLCFPSSTFDDLLDSLARVKDPKVTLFAPTDIGDIMRGIGKREKDRQKEEEFDVLCTEY